MRRRGRTHGGIIRSQYKLQDLAHVVERKTQQQDLLSNNIFYLNLTTFFNINSAGSRVRNGEEDPATEKQSWTRCFQVRIERCCPERNIKKKETIRTERCCPE